MAQSTPSPTSASAPDLAAPSGLRRRWTTLHRSTHVLTWELGIIIGASAFLGALGHPLILSYAWHKTLHILGAVLFLGNIIVTALWMSWMVRTRDPALIRHAAAATNWADVAFTAPGVLLLVTNGLIMATALGGLAANPWALWGLALFGVSGIIWIALLIPAQQHMLQTATAAAENGAPLPASFDRALRRWSTAGVIATVVPLAVLGLMVLRPGA